MPARLAKEPLQDSPVISSQSSWRSSFNACGVSKLFLDNRKPSQGQYKYRQGKEVKYEVIHRFIEVEDRVGSKKRI